MIEPTKGEEANQPCVNQDRELWRKVPGDFYSPSIHATASGGIGMNLGGSVHVKPVEAWHGMATDLAAAREEIERLKSESHSLRVSNGGLLNKRDRLIAERDAAIQRAEAAEAFREELAVKHRELKDKYDQTVEIAKGWRERAEAAEKEWDKIKRGDEHRQSLLADYRRASGAACDEDTGDAIDRIVAERYALKRQLAEAQAATLAEAAKCEDMREAVQTIEALANIKALLQGKDSEANEVREKLIKVLNLPPSEALRAHDAEKDAKLAAVEEDQRRLQIIQDFGAENDIYAEPDGKWSIREHDGTRTPFKNIRNCADAIGGLR